MPTHKSFHSYLIESLKDPEEAAAYLEAVLESGDPEHILLALKNVTEARRSLADNSNEAESDLETYDQLLVNCQSPDLSAISLLLNKLGLKLSVTVNQTREAA
jgi:DNA-binding phage protein